MSREEHLVWAKKRALEYLTQGDLQGAYTSMASDLSKHPETANYPKVLDQLGLMEVLNKNTVGVRRFIEGFN